MDRGGTSPALRAGEGEDRGRWRGARWRTPWSGSGPARWTVAERPWGGTSRGVRPGARSAEAREGSKRIPGRRSPRRRSVEPGRPASSTAADTPETFLVSQGRESFRGSQLSDAGARRAIVRLKLVAGRSQRVLVSAPLWGSGHGIAEVSQDPETQGVAAKGYALFGVGSALGAATERDPHRIGLDAVSARSALKFAGERQAGVCTSTPPRRNPDLRLLRDSPEVVLASAALLDRSTFSNYPSCSSCRPPVP